MGPILLFPNKMKLLLLAMFTAYAVSVIAGGSVFIKYTCDCSYFSTGGCRITSPVNQPNTACRCSYMGFWTCTGTPHRCMDPNSKYCKMAGVSYEHCLQGAGDCDGYTHSESE